jgi:hypothetical protein
MGPAVCVFMCRAGVPCNPGPAAASLGAVRPALGPLLLRVRPHRLRLAALALGHRPTGRPQLQPLYHVWAFICQRGMPVMVAVRVVQRAASPHPSLHPPAQGQANRWIRNMHAEDKIKARHATRVLGRHIHMRARACTGARAPPAASRLCVRHSTRCVPYTRTPLLHPPCVQVLKPSDPGLMRVLEAGVSFGLPVLVEGLGEAGLEAGLHPLLLKQVGGPPCTMPACRPSLLPLRAPAYTPTSVTHRPASLPSALTSSLPPAQTYKQGGQLLVRLGDSAVEFSPSFRLYMTTPLPNPHYLPETTGMVGRAVWVCVRLFVCVWCT